MKKVFFGLVLLFIMHKCFGDDYLKPGLYIVEPGKGDCKIQEWYPGYEAKPLPAQILQPEYFIRRMKGVNYKDADAEKKRSESNNSLETSKLKTRDDFESLVNAVKSGDIEKLKSVKANSPILRRPKYADLGLLDYAIIWKKKDILEKLILLGADINEINTDGFTPVHTAAAHGTVDDLYVLLKYSASISNRLTPPPLPRNPSDDELSMAGWYARNLTPIHSAAFSGDVRKVRALIDKGAKINVSGSLGFTPLHLAAYKGYKDVYHALVDAGANQFAEDFLGKKPISYLNDPEANSKFQFETRSIEWENKYRSR